MTARFFILTLMCVGVSLAPKLKADHPSIGLGSSGATPIATISANTLPQGKFSVGSHTEYVDLDEISSSRLISNAEEDHDADVHSVKSLFQTSLSAMYGATDNLMLGVRVPVYIERSDIREAHYHEGEETEVLDAGDAEGFGDALLFGMYRFFHNSQTKQSAAIIAGVKTPTGDTDEKSKHGERFEAELQPGTGSWDPFVGITFSKQWARWAFDTNVLFVNSTEGSQDTEVGDLFNYNAAMSYRLNAHDHDHDHDSSAMGHLNWDVIFELNGEWRDKEDIDGDTNDNSGGSLVYLSPGVRATSHHGLSAALAIGFPVIEDLNGLQSEPESRIIFTISKVFN